MKDSKICFYNNTIREHEECRNALWLELFYCQAPLKNIECKESTADILLKTIKKLNQDNVRVDIVYNDTSIKITAKNNKFKITRELKKGQHNLYNLEYEFLKLLIEF